MEMIPMQTDWTRLTKKEQDFLDDSPENYWHKANVRGPYGTPVTARCGYKGTRNYRENVAHKPKCPLCLMKYPGEW